jgi:hypothetical protein
MLLFMIDPVRVSAIRKRFGLQIVADVLSGTSAPDIPFRFRFSGLTRERPSAEESRFTYLATWLSVAIRSSIACEMRSTRIAARGAVANDSAIARHSKRRLQEASHIAGMSRSAPVRQLERNNAEQGFGAAAGARQINGRIKSIAVPDHTRADHSRTCAKFRGELVGVSRGSCLLDEPKPTCGCMRHGKAARHPEPIDG